MTGQGQAVHVSKCPKTGKDVSMNDEHPGSHVPVRATSLDPCHYFIDIITKLHPVLWSGCGCAWYACRHFIKLCPVRRLQSCTKSCALCHSIGPTDYYTIYITTDHYRSHIISSQPWVLPTKVDQKTLQTLLLWILSASPSRSWLQSLERRDKWDELGSRWYQSALAVQWHHQ